MKKQLNGDDLIKLGYKPGKHFGKLLEIANSVHEPQDNIPEVCDGWGTRQVLEEEIMTYDAG